MGEFSEISWTTHTFNPWMGCTKVSEACKFCYAERDMDHRYGKVQWGPSGTRVLTTDANWRKPLKWNLEAEQAFRDYSRAAMSCQSEYDIPEPPERPRVFCASLADVFEDWDGPIVDSKGDTLYEVDGRFMSKQPGQWFLTEREPVTLQDVRKRLFRLIDATPHLDWLLLTKRPENVARMMPAIPSHYGTFCPECRSSMDNHVLSCESRGRYRRNVWLGCSVENQERAEERIPELLKCRDLAKVLFLSCEPLLGPLDLTPWVFDRRAEVRRLMNGPACLNRDQADDMVRSVDIDWVICGGESGHHARPPHPDWFRSLRDQCVAASVAFHHKQNGEWLHMSQFPPGSHSLVGTEIAGPPHDFFARVGKKKAGRTLDGREWDELPFEKATT